MVPMKLCAVRIWLRDGALKAAQAHPMSEVQLTDLLDPCLQLQDVAAADTVALNARRLTRVTRSQGMKLLGPLCKTARLSDWLALSIS